MQKQYYTSPLTGKNLSCSNRSFGTRGSGLGGLAVDHGFILAQSGRYLTSRREGRGQKLSCSSLALVKSDPAGELGIQVQEYDTDMGYNGSIGYVTENGDHYWAYFSQIIGDK